MLNIRCKAEDYTSLSTLRQFQGDLKKRTGEDIEGLMQSIRDDGLLMPLAIWNNGDICAILDGHARYEALIRMAIDDPTILESQIPVIVINASDEAEAKRMLLQITSSYGRVNKKGLTSFVASIPDYRINSAPIVVKTLGIGKVQAAPKIKDSETVVLRLEVRKEMVGKLTEVLKNVEGVNIL
jgi:hypothetical protein